MSKFAAALNARKFSPTPEPSPSDSSAHLNQGHSEELDLVHTPKRVGRPAGKRSDATHTQVTGYVPAQLYYDIRIKLIQRKMKNRKATVDFSDLLREWMERWLAEQP